SSSFAPIGLILNSPFSTVVPTCTRGSSFFWRSNPPSSQVGTSAATRKTSTKDTTVISTRNLARPDRPGGFAAGGAGGAGDGGGDVGWVTPADSSRSRRAQGPYTGADPSRADAGARARGRPATRDRAER